MGRNLIFLICVSILTCSGCAVNPVTGKQELALVSEAQEIRVGEEQYRPSRQMQGGDYVVDPELTRYVNGVGQKLSAVSDRKLPYEVCVINNSTPNAWALPGGKIAVNRGLLTELKNEAELAAVVSHEMVHAAARHGAKAMERGVLLQGAVLAAGIAVSDSRYANLGIIGSQLAATLVTQKYSRDAEKEADAYGMNYMAKAAYDPNAAVSLQEVFVRLSEQKRQDWLGGLFSSHPPSRERVEANRKKALELGAGGVLEADRFKTATAHLVKTKEGYKAHDEGRKTLSEGRTQEALALARKALKIEPREGLFHALLGDCQYAQKNYPDALTNYNRAIERNPNFFHFYVQRGLARQKLNDHPGARSDLENSLKLLPTAMAYKALGDVSLALREREKAIQYYRTASGSGSDAGQEARSALVRLDLPSAPQRYLKADIGLGKDGKAYARVVNSTPLSIQNIRLMVKYQDQDGKDQSLPLSIRQTLMPGKAAVIPLGLSQNMNLSVLQNMQAVVISADVQD